MAISDSQKVDLLWKKTIFGVTDTSISGKEAQNETIPSPIVVDSRYVWGQADQIPTTPPTVTDTVIQVKTGVDAVTMVPDPTVPGNRAWIAVSDPSGSTTDAANRVGGWIPPSFGAGYLLGVYTDETVDPANSLNSLANNYEWQFDYVAGTLQFLNNVPNVGSGIVIEGYRYVGTVGGGVGGGGGLNNVVEDLTPELGGDLDVNGFRITSSTGEIVLATGDENTQAIIKADEGEDLNLEGGDNGGRVTIHGYAFPDNVGSVGDVLVLDAAYDLQWAPLPDGTLPFGTADGQVLTWTASGWTPLPVQVDNELPDGIREDDMLVWNGTRWVSVEQPQAITPFSGEWTDILNKPATFATDWSLVANIPQELIDYVNGNWTVPAHSHTSADLTDFPATPGTGEFLMWDGTAWTTAIPATGSGSGGSGTSGPTTWPSGSAVGDYWRWNGGAWVTAPALVIPDTLADLSDTSVGSASSGDLLSFDGTNWVATAPAAGISALNDIADVIVTSATSGDVLTFDGTNWIAQAVSGGSGSGIENVVEDTSPQLGGSLDTNGYQINGFTYPTFSSTPANAFMMTTNTLGVIEAVTISATAGQAITWDGSAWTASFADYDDLLNVPSTFPTNIGQISDFPTTSTTGDVIMWNGTNWVASAPPAGNGFSGSWNDLTDVPTEFTPEAHTQAWSTITSRPTLAQSGGNITGSIDLDAGTFSLTGATGGGGSAQYEWAVFQFQSGNVLNQASTQQSSGITITYEDTSAANICGFVFNGYNLPPGAIAVYAQKMPTSNWRMQDVNAFVDTPVYVADDNGDTTDPDLIDFNQAFTGKMTMGFSTANLDNDNLVGLPTYYSKILVIFSMLG